MASLPSFALWGDDDLGGRGVVLRKEFGPWAPRRLAALRYEKTCGPLPLGLDWATDALTMHIPDPLLRASVHGGGLNSHAPQFDLEPPHAVADRTTGFAILCGDAQMPPPLAKAMRAADVSRTPKDKDATLSPLGRYRLVGPLGRCPRPRIILRILHRWGDIAY